MEKIKNSLMITGSPLAGKSTKLLNIIKKDNYQDLILNLWNFRPDYAKNHTATANFLRCRNGNVRALSLPLNTNGWFQTLLNFRARHPHIKRIVMDEVQCIYNPAYILALLETIRDNVYHANIPVVFGGLLYDSWHKKYFGTWWFKARVEKFVHLDHQCMINGCHRKMQRRIHIVNGRPFYKKNKYERFYARHHNDPHYKFDCISVCYYHFFHMPNIKKQLKQGKTPLKNNLPKAVEQARKQISQNRAKQLVKNIKSSKSSGK